MNILQVHNKYKISGGEWTVLTQEFDLLSKNHQVDQYIADNNSSLNSLPGLLKLAFTTHYNRHSRRLLAKKLAEKKYGVMHVHNFFPLLSPSVFDAARGAGVPSVMTLHNYRLIHPNGLLYYNGAIDKRSVKGSAYSCVMDGVYRDSKLQTAITAHMIEYHRKKRTWLKMPSLFIALSQFSKDTFVEGGLPEDRIAIKPNFLKDPLGDNGKFDIGPDRKNAYLYAGRISYEKGVEDLVKCWLTHNIDATLIIAGEGPLKEKLRKQTKGNSSIVWRGKESHENILKLYADCKAVIFPTKWYEGQPLVLLEALSLGCPVITSRIGNPQDIIDDGVTGLHFNPGDIDDLHQKINLIQNNPEKRNEMGVQARQMYLQKYTPEQNYKMLLEIYRQAAAHEEALTRKHFQRP